MNRIKRYVLDRKVLLASALLLAVLSLAAVSDLLSRQPQTGSAETPPDGIVEERDTAKYGAHPLPDLEALPGTRRHEVC